MEELERISYVGFEAPNDKPSLFLVARKEDIINNKKNKLGDVILESRLSDFAVKQLYDTLGKYLKKRELV